MTKTNTKFQHVVDLEPHLGGKDIYAYAVCFDGSLAILLGDETGKEQAFGVSTGESYSLTFLHVDNDVISKTQLAPNAIRFPKVQMLPDGSILVVGARCASRTDNACLYSADGSLTKQFHLGDGIEDVQVSRRGEIWVSYFDEGVYGNSDWEHNSSSSCGLSCFNTDGAPIWEFQPPDKFEHIDDCYAMAVVGDDLFICYYSYFPVVRISADKEVKGWENKISGATAIAVKDSVVALYGGYSGETTRCVLQTFGSENKLTDSKILELTIPGGLEKADVTGRESSLYALSGLNWYRLDLSDINSEP